MHSTAIGKTYPPQKAGSPLTKLLLVMKMTAFLLLFALLQVAARSSAQVTLKEKSASLEKVLAKIKQQSDYGISYDLTLIRSKGKPVIVDVANVPVEKALEEIFKGQDQLTYSLNGKVISIKAKVEKKIDPIIDGINPGFEIVPPPPITVNGKVLNENDEPIPGVTVTIKGTNNRTSTNEAGEFTIVVSDANATLVFSAITIVPFETKVNGKTELILTAKVKVSELQEIVVNKGYYSTTQRLNTGSVVKVSGEDIAKQPINNPLLALQGRVPGLFITQSTGVPGGGIKIQLRGINSLQSGNDPLYIIDGVPYTSQLLPNLGASILQITTSGNVGGNPLAFINPSDIEAISVLKDADATAIYGSRGGNGVVLITTKKGGVGKSKVDFNVATGFGKIGNKLDLMNTQQYLQMRREAFKNDGVTATVSNAPDLLVWDTTRYTDWQKELIGGTAHYTDIQSSISGGNTGTQFLIGTTYHKETTVYPGDFSDQKASVHFNINNASANGKLKTSFFGNYLIDNNEIPNSDLTGSAANLAPDAPNIYNSDGSLNWANSTWSNPLSVVRRKYRVRTNNLISNIKISYQLFQGLELTSNFGYTNMQINEISSSPISSLNPAITPQTGSASFTNNNIHSWIIEPQLDYQIPLGKGKMEVLLGSTFQQNTNEGQIINVTGYTSDAMLENILGGPNRSIQSVIYQLYKYNAVFGRVNYNLSNKYIINLTMRRDGSSRFGDNNKFHNFGSFAAAWIFSQEKFIQNELPVLSYGKLRSSYGTTGNDQIGDYKYYDLFSAQQYPYQGVVGLTPSSLYNPNLEWEETKKLEFALDLGFLKDRILLNTTFYLNKSSNQLTSILLPSTTGFATITSNFPATVQNRGWEFSLNTTNIQSKYFVWKSSINLSIPKNKLVSFPGIENTSYKNSLIVGEPIKITKAFHLIGVNDTTGVYQFTDNKGNLTYSPSSLTDNNIIINTAPKYYGGFSNSLSYKEFQVDFLFQFTKQVGLNDLFQRALAPGGSGTVVSTSNLARWQNPGDRVLLERFTQNTTSTASTAYRSYARLSDAAYTDASFVRLKNVSISYQLPQRIIKKLRIQSCRIYVHAQNLFTLTKYEGIDPESQSISILPPLRVLSTGIAVSL